MQNKRYKDRPATRRRRRPSVVIKYKDELRSDVLLTSRPERRFHLSVLDLASIGEGGTASEALKTTVRLARLAERVGYTRFWLAEHHGMPSIASSSPEILIAHV